MWDSSHSHTYYIINQIVITGSALIPYVTTQGKVLATSVLYFKKISYN